MPNRVTKHATQFLGPAGPVAYVDSGTELFKLTPSAGEVYHQVISTDTATELFRFTPSGIEITGATYTDGSIELFKLVPSGVDIVTRVYTDGGATRLSLTPYADEHYCPQRVELEGDLDTRWVSTERVQWASSFGGNRWDSEFLGVGEGFVC